MKGRNGNADSPLLTPGIFFNEILKLTKSGLIVPDVGGYRQATVQTGIAVAVGPGYKKDNGDCIPLSVKVGDRVVFNHHGMFVCSIMTEHGPKTFNYVNEGEIIAIISQ